MARECCGPRGVKHALFLAFRDHERWHDVGKTLWHGQDSEHGHCDVSE